jgi:hypothetical protein
LIEANAFRKGDDAHEGGGGIGVESDGLTKRLNVAKIRCLGAFA